MTVSMTESMLRSAFRVWGEAEKTWKQSIVNVRLRRAKKSDIKRWQ